MSYLDEIAARIRAEVDPALVPDDADDLFRAYAVLLRAVGGAVSASDVHDAWCAWMQQRDPGHGSIVPFESLAVGVQAQDEPFVAAIRAVAARQPSGS